MRHLTETELIEHYYGEADDVTYIAGHLRECGDCARSYAALIRDLSEIQPITPPVRAESYGADVWNSIRASLPVYESKRRKSWFGSNLWLNLSYATAVLVLIAGAFIAGRHWEHYKNPQQPQVAATPSTDDKAHERVVLLVLGDHLDRSERLLVELRHGASGDSVQAEARDLLSANRLYRQSAAEAGDPALNNALDHLERVLVEVANQPGGLTPASVAELQKQMNTDGLLFEVRVLRSRMQNDQNDQKQTARPKGVTI
jgi:hypothetical protein